KPRLVRKPWFCSVTGSLSAWPVPAVLHYRAHPLTIRAPARKLGRPPEEVGPMPDVARTLDLPPGQRFEYWKHALSDTFVPLEVGYPGSEKDFRGRLRGAELGRLRFIEVLADPHTARRTPRLVRSDPSGCYKLGLQLRGSSVLDETGSRDGIRLAGNVLDLLGTVLAERLDCAPPDPDAAHRALMVQITAYIEAHLGEAGLAPAQIAAAHHISLRQLHKLFHASGTTVAGWIRQRRLEHCGHDLRDPRWCGRPVAAIGARWGYPDPAHFSRLFKAAYGVGPRDYRASVRLRTLPVKRRALACKTGGGRPREHGRHEPHRHLRWPPGAAAR